MGWVLFLTYKVSPRERPICHEVQPRSLCAGTNPPADLRTSGKQLFRFGTGSQFLVYPAIKPYINAAVKFIWCERRFC